MVNPIVAKESIYNNFLASFMLFVQFHSRDKSQRQDVLTKSSKTVPADNLVLCEIA